MRQGLPEELTPEARINLSGLAGHHALAEIKPGTFNLP